MSRSTNSSPKPTLSAKPNFTTKKILKSPTLFVVSSHHIDIVGKKDKKNSQLNV